ncbi:MAG: hypothetical protein AABX61_03490 [Nanoarchaeota archaeon]
MEEYKGKLIHCNGIRPCQEPAEELKNYIEQNGIDEESFKNIFFKDDNLEYIQNSAKAYGIHFHIATHSIPTDSCQEKADITGLPLERVIKGVYLEDIKTELVYALAIPGNRTYVKSKLAEFLNIDNDEIESRIRKSRWLPIHIKSGTVHPFVNPQSFTPDGKLEYVLFDENHLEKRRTEMGLDDFSFTTHPSTGYDNHRISIQMNYWEAFLILDDKFGHERIKKIDLV